MPNEPPVDVSGEVPPRTPRWVKVFGIITLVIAVLFLVLKLAGGGGHGPGRHMPGGDAGSQALRQSH